MIQRSEVMLLLSRRIGEQIIIDEHITITVVGKHGNQVQLGIEAPREVPIRRHELSPKGLDDATRPENAERRRAYTTRSW
jgi:carbon storage regulator